MNLEFILQPKAYCTEWRKSERERQRMYINTCEWNLDRGYRLTYVQDSNGDADIKNRVVDIVWDRESGMNWSSTETCTLPSMCFLYFAVSKLKYIISWGKKMLQYFHLAPLSYNLSMCVCESPSHFWLFAMPWTLPVFSIHGILQARILAWVASSFSRGSAQPRIQTGVSHSAGRFFIIWAMGKPKL